jgi:hypothetical protein
MNRQFIIALLAASSAWAAPRMFTGDGFTFPFPDGYADISGKLRPDGRGFVALSDQAKKGHEATIVFQRPPIAGGTMGDLELCKRTGEAVAGGARGKLLGARLISGPAGKSCQMEISAPEGHALITELNGPSATWLMTCNYGEGNARAEKACRATLAGFKFTK